MRINQWPPLPLDQWKQTKEALHVRMQIVGKIRLALSPPMNHWWHAPLYMTSRGLTTSPIPQPNGSFDMEFDLLSHDLVIRTSEGRTHRIHLPGQSVAEFFRDLMTVLNSIGVEAHILAKPFDMQDQTPFESNERPSAYDAEFVDRFRRILTEVDLIFKEFRGRFIGKCSPVHFFWHSFDLAVTRFSGRRAPDRDGTDPVTREAYSHEVISAGFWPGDERLQSPAFYAYAWPEPSGLTEQALRPDGAFWQTQQSGSLALLKYDDMRDLVSPHEALLDFLQSTYEAAANLANWDRSSLERAELLAAMRHDS